jgi:hypothetical protein
MRGLIDSVLAQSYPHWRLYVGDNGSVDDIDQVMQSYTDPRISYHRYDRCVGVTESFNRTAALAETDWVMPIGADDRLPPNALARMACALDDASSDRAEPIVMIVAKCRRVSPAGVLAEAQYYGSRLPARLDAGRHDSRTWLALAASGGPFAWNMGAIAMWRPVLLESGPFRAEVGLATDMELIFRLAAYGDVLYIDEPLLDFAVRAESEGNLQWSQNRGDPKADVPLAVALLASLKAHEGVRQVSDAERRAVQRGVARTYLQRATQHRLPGGLGRRGAVRDIWRASRLNWKAVFEPGSFTRSLAAVAAPDSLVKRATAVMQRRRHEA